MTHQSTESHEVRALKQASMSEAAPMWGRLRDIAGRSGNLIAARVELAGGCNLRCIHCYLGDSLDDQCEPDFSTECGVALMEELAAVGCLSVVFTGGELGLRTDWATIAWAAKRHRMAISLLTNATVLTDDDLAEIERLHVRMVGVSLNGSTAASHDAVTGVEGSFAATIENLARLRKAGVRCRIGTVIMRDAVSEFKGIMAIAQELDCQFIAEPTVRPHSDGSDDAVERFRAPAEQLRVLYTDETIMNGCREGALIRSESEPRRASMGNCAAGTTFAHVCANGNVYACVGFGEPFGNIVKSSFSEIWQGEVAKRYRALLAQPLRGCTRCGLLAYCTQRCPSLALAEDGDLSGPSSRACEIAALVKQLRNERQNCDEWRTT